MRKLVSDFWNKIAIEWNYRSGIDYRSTLIGKLLTFLIRDYLQLHFENYSHLSLNQIFMSLFLTKKYESVKSTSLDSNEEKLSTQLFDYTD